jgi:glycosyltransferase involved in cell wall biosynthesis
VITMRSSDGTILSPSFASRLTGSVVADPRPQRVRVLHIIQNLNYGGMERLLADIVRKGDSALIEPHVLVLQYLGRFSEEMRGFAVVHQAAPQSRYSMIWPRQLAEQIRRIRPDVVHSHSGVWYKASLAARLAGVPMTIHTDHGRQVPDPWLSKRLDGAASRRTTVAVAVSAAVAEQLRHIVDENRCRVQVVLNGVHTEAHKPRMDDGDLRNELGISSAAPIIGSIGRLERIKGYDIMLEAFALLCRRWEGPEMPCLLIGGDGSEREKLERTARARGIDENVRLLGWRDDIAALHSAFSLFTMSSRSEGTSVSLLEAMSAGLCPVVTDVGGNRAVLGERLQHRLVASENPGQLADAWMVTLRNRDAALADGLAARDRVLAEYSLERMVAQYQELYLEAVPSLSAQP